MIEQGMFVPQCLEQGMFVQFCIQNLLFTSLKVPVVYKALFLFLRALNPFLLRRCRVETVRAIDAVSRAKGVLLGGGQVGGLVGGRDSKRASRRAD